MSFGPPYAVQPEQPQQKSNKLLIVAIILGALFVAMLLCAGVLAALLLPAISAAREAAQRMQSSNHLKQIGLALHNYHDQYGSFPPAYSTDANGQPLLSWRVLILPQLEHRPLYEQFHLDEPWDSPHNSTLLDQMPMFYLSPRYDTTSTSTETNYVALQSPGSVFSGASAVSFRDITDGTSNTAAVIELEGSGIPWTSPDDVTPEQAFAVFSSGGPTGGSNLLIIDGSVRYVSHELDKTTFDAMVTTDGGEGVPF